MKKTIAFFITNLFLISCNSPTESNFDFADYKNTTIPISHLMDSLKLKKKDLRIHIDKSDYKLSIITDSKIIKEYPVVFGKNPIDDKLMEGDRRTPEGNFKIRDFYPHKSWSKFIWINYPTKDSWKKHKKAKSENKIPDSATIGGEIGIHGVPKNRSNLISQKNNWTWGCISLTNTDLEDLYSVVYKDMKIVITK